MLLIKEGVPEQVFPLLYYHLVMYQNSTSSSFTKANNPKVLAINYKFNIYLKDCN
jgi:hypothetical protein